MNQSMSDIISIKYNGEYGKVGVHREETTGVGT